MVLIRGRSAASQAYWQPWLCQQYPLSASFLRPVILIWSGTIRVGMRPTPSVGGARARYCEHRRELLYFGLIFGCTSAIVVGVLRVPPMRRAEQGTVDDGDRRHCSSKLFHYSVYGDDV